MNEKAKGAVTIELDSVKKSRNDKEYRYIARARCLEHSLEEVGDGPIIKKIIGELLKTYPEGDRMLYVIRDGKHVFNPMLLKEFGKSNNQPEHLKRKA